MLITEFLRSAEEKYSSVKKLGDVERNFIIDATDKAQSKCDPLSGEARIVWICASYRSNGEELYSVMTGLETDGVTVNTEDLDASLSDFDEEIRTAEEAALASGDARAYLRELSEKEDAYAKEQLARMEKGISKSLLAAIICSCAAFVALITVIIIAALR